MGRLVVIGRDGKHSPPRHPTAAEMRRAATLAHYLVHGEGLSVRTAQLVMRQHYGLHRAVGTIHRDLAAWTCRRCGCAVARLV